MMNRLHFDVIVIGAGHAGCEAALAAARLGARTMLITMNLDHIAQMSCNPAIGGIAKGQVVREIDALGGEMGKNTDATAIQFRMLNRSKGPAVWSPRAQCDKVLYQRRMKFIVERQPNLFVHQAEVLSLCRSGDRVTGVETCFAETFAAHAVVVSAGTFLKGLLHYGHRTFQSGRAGDLPSNDLSRCLREEFALELGRLKTGTPPRIMAQSIDLTQMTPQPGESESRFSHWPDDLAALRTIAPADLPQRPCYSLHTTARTKEIVQQNIERAPMYNGTIAGIGTRYCPSFEDKIMRFSHHDTHHAYLEPEGAFTDEYYLNGVSTSLPVDVQWELVRSLPGMQNAELARYAYAVEYDFVFPHQLDSTLALKRWQNLFTAGQVNGTTGYEEAAGQGLVAGVNAALLAANKPERMVLKRDQAYIGVMVDDLVTKEIIEPYRLFTSRAEHRLSLRQDNCCRRLSKIGYELGLLPEQHYRKVAAAEREIEEGRNWLQTQRSEGMSLWDRLRRKQVTIDEIDEMRYRSAEARNQLAIEAHYEGYIQVENRRVASLKKLEYWKIPVDFAYDIRGMRNEARIKLERVQPDTLAQAARIDGVTPAEIALLQVHLKRRGAMEES